MNIEFEKLKEVCHNHPINVYRCHALAYDEDNKSFPPCTEANCPLKAEEKVCRWITQEEDVYESGCLNNFGEYRMITSEDEPVYCPFCGGRIEWIKWIESKGEAE